MPRIRLVRGSFDARESLGVAVDLIIDGGPAAHGLESTIVGLIEARPTLLRPGAIGRAEIEAEYRERYHGEGLAVSVFSGKFEMDLNELSEAEAAEFRDSVGVTESGMAGAIRVSYALLGLVSFLTAGPDECRAWTVTAGSPAPVAAGKIHSDLQRGFIRAEVIKFEDLIAAGSEVEAKKRGVLRTEGKQYIVQDGDIVNILFNV